MSDDKERVNRLAAERYPTPAHELEYPSSAVREFRRGSFTAGYLASKRLSEAEWAEERNDVAFVIRLKGDTRNIDQRLIDESMRQAEAAMISLGFTRTSEPGGDTC